MSSIELEVNIVAIAQATDAYRVKQKLIELRY